MDVLMLLHSDPRGSDEVIPGKLFEYILAEKPIVSIGPKNMEASKIVSQNNLGYVIDLDDEEDLSDKLTRIYQDWKQGTLISYKAKDHAQFSRPYQYSKFLEILE